MGKLRQLLIPGKNSNKEVQPEYGIDMRAIEQWAIEVAKAIEAAGGTYASLTGPGQTMTPGELFQAGDFDIGGGLSVRGPGAMTVTTNAGITLDDSGSGLLGNITITESGPSGITISDLGGGGIEIGSSAATRILGASIGFFTGVGTTQITVTGSRGGNAALASLLSALANYGLIIDSTSP